MTSSKVMREKIDAKSEAQGFPESRLPSFTDEESAMILGSSDFLGMNFYTAQVDLKHCQWQFATNPSIIRLYILRQVIQNWWTSMQVATSSYSHPWISLKPL